jgi:hypothetical protein
MEQGPGNKGKGRVGGWEGGSFKTLTKQETSGLGTEEQVVRQRTSNLEKR